MLPVLRVAAGADDVWMRQVVQTIANDLALSREDRAQLIPSGRQTLLDNRVQWAKTYLTKAGLLQSLRRGLFRITDEGRKLLAEQPARIDNKMLLRYEEFRSFWKRRDQNLVAANDQQQAETQPPSLDLNDETPIEVIKTAQAQLESALAEELIDRILTMPPDFFERLVVALVVAMGYGATAIEAAQSIGRSGDNGVDGVIHQDALGLDRIYIQAKRYGRDSYIDAAAIRDFAGSLSLKKASKGVFVTTSSFSRQAKETAENLPARIVLIDGPRLASLMIRYNIGCRIEGTVLIKHLDEDFFE